jgi:hypothetical protein
MKKMLGLLIIILLLGYNSASKQNNIPDPIPVVVPNNKPVFLYPVIQYRNIEENTIYGDVFNHSKQEPYTKSNRRINVHETSHGITSELRNHYERLWKQKLNVFYVLDGKCIILNESNITMSHVIEYIPPILRSYRYNLYFIEQTKNWNDMPSYIIDEWNSYILGSKCAVQDFNNGLITENVDAVSGCLDFSIYAICFAMAVKDHDKEYWENYGEFKESVKFLLIQAEKTFNEGMKIKNFVTATQLKLLNDLRTHKDAEKIRQFLIDEFDGIFVK